MSKGASLLTDAQIFNALKSVEPDAVRLPPGFAAFARAIEAEIRATKPSAGWQLVPAVPTQEMCAQGQWKAQEWPKFPLRISPIYQAMLAAAPSARGQDEFDAWRQS